MHPLIGHCRCDLRRCDVGSDYVLATGSQGPSKFATPWRRKIVHVQSKKLAPFPCISIVVLYFSETRLTQSLKTHAAARGGYFDRRKQSLELGPGS